MSLYCFLLGVFSLGHHTLSGYVGCYDSLLVLRVFLVSIFTATK